MKFNYQEMDSFSKSNMRFYQIPNGKQYPSITTVLGGTVPKEKAESLKRWQESLGVDKADKKTKEASRHGTSVHLLSERFLKKETLIQSGDEFKPEDISAFNALKTKLNKIDEIWGQEVALYSDIIKVAGRTDLVGVYKNIEAIIDFKTSSNLKSDKQIEDYKLQLCAYSIMHNELFNTDISSGVILMVSGAGFPQEFVVNLHDYYDPLLARIDEFYLRTHQ